MTTLEALTERVYALTGLGPPEAPARYLLHLEATLPHPPGKNELYEPSIVYRTSKSGGKVPVANLHLSHAVRKWMTAGQAALERQWPTLPSLPQTGGLSGRYYLALGILYHTNKHDVDASAAIVQDTVAAALGVNDSYVASSWPLKVPCPKEEEKIELRVEVLTVRDRNAFGTFSLDCWYHDLLGDYLRARCGEPEVTHDR